MKPLRSLSFVVALALGGAAFMTPRDAHAVGQAVGRVVGNVIEQTSQAPVPGALVELTGGSGVHQKTQTQEDGSFELLSIPPGTYNLVLSYEGMKPVKRKVVVNPDAATPVNIVWSAESAQEETTVVEEERHLTNPDSSQTGTVYSVSRANQLPLSRSYQSIATQIPGVTSNNGGNPQVKGGRATGNHYRINGLDTTDPVTGTFSANFQQDALETIQVETGGFEAKDNALGSLIQVQTKRGTNEFHGSGSAYWSPTALVDYDSFGPYPYDGNKPWDYSKLRPPQGRYELNVNAQGPIIKNHLFFNVGFGYSRRNSVTPAGPPRSVQAPSQDFISYQPLVGLTFVPVDEHRIHVEWSADPSTIDYSSNTGVTANRSTPYSQTYQTQGGSRLTSEWAWQANKHVQTKVMFGYNQNQLDIGPQGVRGIPDGDLANGVAYDFNRPLHSNSDDSTQWFNTRNRTLTIRRRMQLDASVTASGEAGGHHEAEIGVQTAQIEQRFAQTFSGGTATQDDYFSGYGLTYEDSGGGPVNTGLCDLDPNVNPGAAEGNYTGAGCRTRTYRKNFSSHQTGTQFGIYIQDRFKPKKWLTILPGIRWDTGEVTATDSTVAQTVNGFGPRFSVIADVTGDGKTIAQASYGRSTEMPQLINVGTFDQDRRSFTYVEAYNKDTRRFEFQQQLGGASADRIRTDHVPASADEILLSGRREVASGVMARVDYTYRYLRRQNEFNEINTIWDPTGTRVVGYRNGIPTPVTVFGNEPKSVSEYSGIDFILEMRTKNMEIQGGYTLSQTWGPGAGGGAFDNPRFFQFYESYQNVDVRHQIKSSTTFNVFESLTFGFILNWRSGIALRRTFPTADVAGFATMRAPFGYDPGNYSNTASPGNPGQLGTLSDVRSWTQFRSPDLLTLNALITYDFYKLVKQHLQVNVQIQNVLALQSTAGLATADGTNINTNQFATSSSHQDFRSFTLGLRYEF